MQQPEGYIQAENEQLVCKLKMSLYGPKQSSRCWNADLSDILKSTEFKQSGADTCVYMMKNTDYITIIVLYEDDLIVVATTAREITRVKKF